MIKTLEENLGKRIKILGLQRALKPIQKTQSNEEKRSIRLYKLKKCSNSKSDHKVRRQKKKRQKNV